MLNRAMEKVKRALSRRSRSSRSSSSSRDNMSVDYSHRSHASREEEEIPTVPRSHFRIWILTMVEQIIVKNNYERQALELLKRQTCTYAKRFETRFLIMTGLIQDMNQAFTTVGWEISPTSSNHVRNSWPWSSSFLLPLKKQRLKLKFTFGSLTNNLRWP